MIEILITILFFIAFFFPVVYAFHQKLSNKLLFIGSIYGINYIIWLLLFGATLPIALLVIYIIPTIKEVGIDQNINLAISLVAYTSDYWWFIADLTLMLLPIVIRKRYCFVFEQTYT
ncbi:MAG: hypothetical protein GY928_31260 [Colwellia sp.]|nr:hypothetical protein [Colwellia sp.]